MTMPTDLQTRGAAWYRGVQADIDQRASRKVGAARVDQAIRQSSLNFDFGGDNTPITPVTMGSLKLVVPYPSRIVWARLSAGDADDNPVIVTATVRVKMTGFSTFGGSTLLHGTGTIPTLTLDSSHDCDLTGWQTNLVAGDWLIARLMTLTVGAPTWLSLDLLLRPTDVPVGVTIVTDNAADPMTDNSGDQMVFRS